MTIRSFALPLLLVTAFAAAGCDDATDGASDKQVADLRVQNKKLIDDQRALTNRLDMAERQIKGLSEDLASVRRTAVDASSAVSSAATKMGEGGGSDAGSAAPPASTASLSERDREIAAFLERDEGRKSLEVALKAVEAKRDQERQDRMVSGMVDAFAAKANLTASQTESMRKIVGKSMADVRDVWSGMRGDQSPDERQASRGDAMAKMQEIQKRTDDEVKGILDSTQFGIYEQESARMRGMGRGGADGGAPGGFGGRRGQ